MKRKIKNLKELIFSLSEDEANELLKKIGVELGKTIDSRYKLLLNQNEGRNFQKVEDYFIFSDNYNVEYAKWFILQETQVVVNEKVDLITDIFEKQGYYYRTSFNKKEIGLMDLHYRVFYNKYSLQNIGLVNSIEPTMQILDKQYICLYSETIDQLYIYLNRILKFRNIRNKY